MSNNSNNFFTSILLFFLAGLCEIGNGILYDLTMADTDSNKTADMTAETWPNKIGFLDILDIKNY